MHVLPVLDLLNGIVVRGVAGRRDQYRPVDTRLTASSEPLAVARAFREHLNLTRLYVADLDAILNERPNREIYRSLRQEGFELLVDAGLRTVASAEAILAAGADQVIAGLETWPSSEELARLCERVGRGRVIFSLDLKGGTPMGDLTRWNAADPFGLAQSAVAAGVGRLIVLDIAQVGVAGGVKTIDLCRQLLDHFPDLLVITGGGIRDSGDLMSLAALGIEGVLVASALHDGRITRQDVEAVSRVAHPER